MALYGWILKIFFYPVWARREAHTLSQQFAGSWVFVSLSNELDKDLLRKVSGAGIPYECKIEFQLTGFTDDQISQWQSANSKFDEICDSYADLDYNAKFEWNGDEQVLMLELTATADDPEFWFEMNLDVAPQFLEQELDFEANSVSHSAECFLRLA